ncbi:hypothetical protein Tco_1566021, partial [Tanacetum coccineum]
RSWRGGDGGEEGVVVVEVTAVCGRRDGDGVDGCMVSMSHRGGEWRGVVAGVVRSGRKRRLIFGQKKERRMREARLK